MKTAIYTRVSKSDGSQDPENQLRELKAFCERQGWEVTEVYTDFASGGRADRANFKRLMLDASKRKFDNVLFWAMDRFSREGIEATLSYIRQLDSYKVGFRAYQEPFFDSCGPFRNMLVAMFATLASLERAKVSERTLSGLAKARSQGRVGGRPKAEENVGQMKTFRRLKAAGLSVRKIAAEMAISPTTVQRLNQQIAS